MARDNEPIIPTPQNIRAALFTITNHRPDVVPILRPVDPEQGKIPNIEVPKRPRGE